METGDASENALDTAKYQLSARIFRTLKRLVNAHFKLHGEIADIRTADILLFNHFARFETFIPQYLIYEATGEYCCSVASAEFFKGDAMLSNYLKSVGVVPNNHPRLIALLAEQVLRGRKIVMFPEGGMVKDRRVVDDAGQYSTYSRSADQRRKHHSGAAVLALIVDQFKTAVRQNYADRNIKQLQQWVKDIGMQDLNALLNAALRPTMIVPANITFYPIRVDDNILRKSAEVMRKGLTRRHSEELLIESNILLKNTDMDIRLGKPIDPVEYWPKAQRHHLLKLAESTKTIDYLAALKSNAQMPHETEFATMFQACSTQIRDQYMREMYQNVTVNLSHLAASLMMQYVLGSIHQIACDKFHTALYLSIKYIQKLSKYALHRSLKRPESYRTLLQGQCTGLQRFMAMAISSDLVQHKQGVYHFLPKLLKEHDFDDIRTENFIAVYYNEVMPLKSISKTVKKAMADVDFVNRRKLAKFGFDDEIVSLQWDKHFFSEPRYHELNQLQTATESAEPFLFKPETANGVGVVLAHGLLATPAEVREFGIKLVNQGYTVIGVRLKGHGTSPWDLHDWQWQDWMESVRVGYQIMQGFAERIFVAGFSTGGALALRFASENPDKLAGVTAISVPIKFRDSGMMLVPLVQKANILLRKIPSLDGLKLFTSNHQSAHPEINYRHIPIRALNELRKLIRNLEKNLNAVNCPTLIMQGDNDPTVLPKSAHIIMEKLGSNNKQLVMVASDRHGLLLENIGNTHQTIMSFLAADCAFSRVSPALNPASEK